MATGFPGLGAGGTMQGGFGWISEDLGGFGWEPECMPICQKGDVEIAYRTILCRDVDHSRDGTNVCLGALP
eukprot:243847-Karenia_brevis.AAC.1